MPAAHTNSKTLSPAAVAMISADIERAREALSNAKPGSKLHALRTSMLEKLIAGPIYRKTGEAIGY
jgi:hypothetical protein